VPIKSLEFGTILSPLSSVVIAARGYDRCS